MSWSLLAVGDTSPGQTLPHDRSESLRAASLGERGGPRLTNPHDQSQGFLAVSTDRWHSITAADPAMRDTLPDEDEIMSRWRHFPRYLQPDRRSFDAGVRALLTQCSLPLRRVLLNWSNGWTGHRRCQPSADYRKSSAKVSWTSTQTEVGITQSLMPSRMTSWEGSDCTELRTPASLRSAIGADQPDPPRRGDSGRQNRYQRCIDLLGLGKTDRDSHGSGQPGQCLSSPKVGICAPCASSPKDCRCGPHSTRLRVDPQSAVVTNRRRLSTPMCRSVTGRGQQAQVPR